jgi:hypothetical protein
MILEVLICRSFHFRQGIFACDVDAKGKSTNYRMKCVLRDEIRINYCIRQLEKTILKCLQCQNVIKNVKNVVY